jgi:2-haloacid dehalogenase
MRVCLFDVNETLLNMRALDPLFEEAFGEPGVREQWFGQMIQSALVATVTGEYRDFGTVGGAALDMTAARRSLTLPTNVRREILETMRHLPPHPEVRDALTNLRAAGFRLATLTNSTLGVVAAQLESSGLTPFFERVLSADTVSRLKPAAEPYHMAARELNVPIGEIRLIAAHAWDVAGALRAGAAAAFVSRPGVVLDPLAPTPDIVGADLMVVAARIIDLEGRA